MYDENGALQKIRYEYEDYNALLKKTYDLIGGEWKLTGEEQVDSIPIQEAPLSITKIRLEYLSVISPEGDMDKAARVAAVFIYGADVIQPNLLQFLKGYSADCF